MTQNKPTQVNPNKDIPPEQRKEDLKELIKHKEIKDSSTSGNPIKQQESQQREINPFRND
jgi:hypothetical protein